MSTYSQVLAEHSSLPAYTPLLPTSSLSSIAFLSLVSSFCLSCYFSTLKSKGVPVHELAVGGAASFTGAVGLIAAFCAIGANV
ncbi:hypothetical protein MNV49_001852 [Pseudohyphozyma bogoriensis]|nr:hypothetical protein MNV49_001852 [Pseudohyphozyma bogoriensis]